LQAHDVSFINQLPGGAASSSTAALSRLAKPAKRANRSLRRERSEEATKGTEQGVTIRVTLDKMLAERDMSLTELSERVGITIANLSILKTGKAKAVRFTTLEKICQVLDCQPGDILEYERAD
jgi:putative transcriptional regulator